MGQLNTILTGFETALKEIKPANQYQLNVRRVDRNFCFFETMDYHAIKIMADVGTYDAVTSNRSRVPKLFNIYGFVFDSASLQSTAIKMLEDITKAVGKNELIISPQRGVNIISGGPADEIFTGGFGEAPGFQFPHACVRVTCEVEYEINNVDGG